MTSESEIFSSMEWFEVYVGWIIIYSKLYRQNKQGWIYTFFSNLFLFGHLALKMTKFDQKNCQYVRIYRENAFEVLFYPILLGRFFSCEFQLNSVVFSFQKTLLSN